MSSLISATKRKKYEKDFNYCNRVNGGCISIRFNKKPVVTALNATTYTAITVTASPGNSCLPIVAYTDDGTSWYMSDTAAGTDNAPIPADSFFSDDCAQFADGIVFYAKASGGTPNLVVITGRN